MKWTHRCFFGGEGGLLWKSWPWTETPTYRYQRVIPLFRGGDRVRVRLLALRLLAAAAARRLLGSLLQTPLVQTHRLPPLDLQLLSVGLLVPVLAVDVVSPTAFDPLPQSLHHGAVLRYAHRPGGHNAPGGRVHAVVDADTAVGSGSGGGEVPHHWTEWLLFWTNFSPPSGSPLPPPPQPLTPGALSFCVLPGEGSRAGRQRTGATAAAEATTAGQV